MLMKLTPLVNVINILRADILLKKYSIKFWDHKIVAVVIQWSFM
jgi:hypothetical protein